ncbi:MET8 (YBR213W) [Zygosaccharomyces parabailii]|uniref:precorrin-2 dehydrogenase n=1 Tax=Zygosaccharomyces bailii (strain CLIB 213 / ATCC 58445 / CBS 680 / BCRC 21525 / NBRC 1098 / NCYC 1416 / NRRL Y-2227) TaxID=1333698 RepID=A0A8J2T5V3_ZYGB2|nr:MET8 (YBR213W) [Zygosaccharomyces parabailii]CDF88573.1 BN860_13432g1_1 [Zygosaccharomyces bailii CLIB 213]CDH14549.1 related to Siroheme biosynthesis protein MET8 [Zygosaccharomyces bailii ISA1307]
MPPRSLLLAHQLRDKNVLVVGAGAVALTRLKKLIPTGCRITLVAPEVHEEIRGDYCQHVTVEAGRIDEQWQSHGGVYRLLESHFQDEHLSLYQDGVDSGWALILTCIPDGQASRHIYTLAKQKFGSQQLVNVADNKPLCDVYFGANWQDDSLQVLISSNGAGPRFTALLRDEIGSMLDELDLKTSLSRLQELRSRVRSLAPSAGATQFRMKWMSRCTEIFGVRRCCKMLVPELVELFQKMHAADSLDFPPAEIMLKNYAST